MPIKRNHDNKGMIKKDKLEKVLMLLEIDFGSLCGNQIYVEFFKDKLAELKTTRISTDLDPDDLLDLHSSINKVAILHQAIFAQNAWDLFEFMYDEKVSKPGYYHFQFPIDRKKFRKKRVPKKEFLSALKGMCKDNKKIKLLAKKNMKAFYDSMETKLKRPSIKSGKEISDHYADKIADSYKEE